LIRQPVDDLSRISSFPVILLDIPGFFNKQGTSNRLM
jgi:hypothetical protein